MNIFSKWFKKEDNHTLRDVIQNDLDRATRMKEYEKYLSSRTNLERHKYSRYLKYFPITSVHTGEVYREEIRFVCPVCNTNYKQINKLQTITCSCGTKYRSDYDDILEVWRDKDE